MIRKVYIIILLLIPATAYVNAQQLPLYSQYVMNGYLLNPSIAGSDGFTSFNLTAREQWLGFTDAPQTRSFSFQTRLLKKSFVIKQRSVNNRKLRPSSKGRVGLGGFIYHDRNGAVERIGFQGSYAYHIFLRNDQLSFGLSGGLFQFRIREEEITYLDDGDMVIEEGVRKNLYVPDANFGVYYLNYRYFAGFAINNLFQSYLKFGNQALDEYKQIRHYYLMGGYRFEINRDHEIEPSGLIKATERLSIQADIGVKYYYRQDYWAGLVFRTNGTAITVLGVRIKQLHIGYAFDYNLSSIRKYSWGSHELVLALKLGGNARRYRWIQRY
jgi:type IX secretion system PorP/SprF family membrane protein